MTQKKTHALAAGAVAVLAATAPALAGPNEDAFTNAGYTMCDARLLQLAYDDDLIKRVISGAGEKIINGYGDQVKADIESGRAENAGNTALCPAEEFYSADDIVLFAKYWSIDSLSEARQKISELLIDGASADIKDAIDMAR